MGAFRHAGADLCYESFALEESALIKLLALSHAYAEPFTRVGLVDTRSFPEIDLTVVVPQYVKKASPDGFRRLAEEYEKVKPIHTLLNAHRSVHAYAPGLAALLRNLKPDVIFLNYEPWSTAAFQVAVLRRWYGLNAKIVIYTCENLIRRYAPPFIWLEKFTLNSADVVATLPEYEARDILMRKGYSGEIVHIPLGVNTGIFKRTLNPELKDRIAGKNRIVIGYVGRLVREKGIPCLMRAMSALDERYLLLIIGKGPQKEELVRLAAALNMENRVRFVDGVFNDRLSEYLSCMDAFVLPSLTTPNWKEQFGRVLIEAMACEVPVIGSSSGEIPVVIGDAGLVFREGDADDLKEKITRLAGQPELRSELGAKGRKRAVELYDNRVVMNKTVELYKRLSGK
ncbi:MAG: glycosyltransferase [Endomicrobiales bacterium]